MKVLKKRLFFAIMLVALLLAIGTSYYSVTEGWSNVDSFYFSTMTLTTIGYGDLTPTTEGGKIFTSFYAIFGIGIMLYILSSVIGVLVFKQEKYVSRAFSFIGRLGRRKREIREIEEEIKKPVMSKMKKQEREIKELRKKVRPSIRMVKKQEREIKAIEKKMSRTRK